MTAFSINWPYVAFSGLNSTLVVVNAFNRKMIHRIEMPQTQTLVLKTFITDTNDLFALALGQKHYLVYMIDLDESNVKENTTKSLGDLFNIGEPILKYHEDQVQRKKIMAFHVRGSSRKEIADLNHKCMIFIQHGDTIYNWTKEVNNS